jgi:hypothetical protein
MRRDVDRDNYHADHDRADNDNDADNDHRHADHYIHPPGRGHAA